MNPEQIHEELRSGLLKFRWGRAKDDVFSNIYYSWNQLKERLHRGVEVDSDLFISYIDALLQPQNRNHLTIRKGKPKYYYPYIDRINNRLVVNLTGGDSWWGMTESGVQSRTLAQWGKC